MKKISVLFLFLVIFVIGCKPSEQTKEPFIEGITKRECINAGGNWNECGSPCAGTDAEYCIQVCSQQCECGGIAGFKCPEGYKCRLTGKIADELGVCVKE